MHAWFMSPQCEHITVVDGHVWFYFLKENNDKCARLKILSHGGPALKLIGFKVSAAKVLVPDYKAHLLRSCGDHASKGQSCFSSTSKSTYCNIRHVVLMLQLISAYTCKSELKHHSDRLLGFICLY